MKIVIYIVLGIVFTVVAANVFFYLVSMFAMLGWVLGALCVLGLLTYLSILFLSPKKKHERKGSAVTLFNNDGSVDFFLQQPSPLQLTLIGTSASGAAKLANNTSAELLEEADGSVRIKIRSGEKKGEVGWVSASSFSSSKK